MTAKYSCPICGAKGNNNFQSINSSWRCRVCYNFIPDDSEAGQNLDLRQRLRDVYDMLQYGKFCKVLEEIPGLRAEIDKNSPELRDWLGYVELRAEFHILGPIVDAGGNDTHCFTPCIIDSFSRGQLEEYCRRNRLFSSQTENGGAGGDVGADRLRELISDISASADEYGKILKDYKREGVSPYDVFICHKTDAGSGNENTSDYRRAKALYRRLKKLGYKVFFAPETKKEDLGIKRLGEYDNNWRKWIYDALLSSRVMLLIASKKEYLNSPNVRNEWVTFRSFKQDGFYGGERRIMPLFFGKEANDCLQLINDGAGRETYENRYDSFFTTKGKINAAYLSEFVTTELKAPQQDNLRLFDGDPAKIYSFILQSEISSEVGNNGVKERYLRLFRRFRYGDAAVRLGLLALNDDENRDAENGAAKWFLLSGTPMGMAYYAQCLFNGQGGCKRNRAVAFDILAGVNDPFAMYLRALFVVYMYCFQREGCEDVFSELEAKSSISALGGITNFTYARALYGVCLKEGIYIEKDASEAEKLLRGTAYYDRIYGRG